MPHGTHLAFSNLKQL